MAIALLVPLKVAGSVLRPFTEKIYQTAQTTHHTTNKTIDR